MAEIMSAEVCPRCGSDDNAVSNSRRDTLGRRRRRRCRACKATWSTYEIHLALVGVLGRAARALDEIETKISDLREMLSPELVKHLVDGEDHGGSQGGA